MSKLYLLTYTQRQETDCGYGTYPTYIIGDEEKIKGELKRYFQKKAKADWYYIRDGEEVKSPFSPPKVVELVEPDPDVMIRMMGETSREYGAEIAGRHLRHAQSRVDAKERWRKEYEKLQTEFGGV